MNPWVSNAIPVCLAVIRALSKALGLKGRSRLRNNTGRNSVIDKDKIHVEEQKSETTQT